MNEEVRSLRQEQEDLLHAYQQLMKRNMSKVRRLIAMKLQSSTLRYQINKYRNEETKALEQCIRHNEDLQFEMYMIKKLRNRVGTEADVPLVSEI